MATSTTTVTGQQSIPTELMPYFTGASGIPGLLPKAQEVYSKGYAEQIGDPRKAAGLAGAARVAQLSDMEKAVGSELSGMATPTQFAQGTGNVAMGTGAIGQGLSTLQGMTDAEATKAYMSPYIQNVLEVNKAEALRDAQRQLVGQNLANARQGSYGGARSMLSESEANRNLQTKMGALQATGMQSAFDAAQKAQLAAAQQYGTYGSQLGQLGATAGQIGTQQQAADLSRMGAQSAQGGLERSLEQQNIDARYADLLQQLNYPKEQLGGMADILRGVPTNQGSSTTATTTPPPSLASQLTGAGLTGLSLYNMFK